MLINVSRFVATQRVVRDFISERQRKLFAAVKANYAKPLPASETDEYMRGLKVAYDTQYATCGFTWAEVRKALFSRSEEHTSELQSLMRISYAVFCLKKKNTT